MEHSKIKQKGYAIKNLWDGKVKLFEFLQWKQICVESVKSVK